MTTPVLFIDSDDHYHGDYMRMADYVDVPSSAVGSLDEAHAFLEHTRPALITIDSLLVGHAPALSRHAPVVLITGDEKMAMQHYTELPGVSEVWAKPVPPHHLSGMALKYTAEKPRILFVDDEPHLCDLAETFIGLRGATPLIATSIVEAGIFLASSHLVLSDYLMPGGDGVELYLRKLIHWDNKQLPFGIVTGAMEYRRGLPDVPRLNKPFERSELDAFIDELLPEHLKLSLRR